MRHALATGRRGLLAAAAAVLVLPAPVVGAHSRAPTQPPATGTAPYGPPYTATPPTKGALYRDGQDRRYLLGGAWLYAADPGDIGVAQGWWRDVATTAGWTPVTVPNSYNAGDLSSPSMTGSVGWYRRDFTVPAGAFSKQVPKADRRWIIRFESVNYRATVWLNGHELGSHVIAYVPFEFDLKYLRAGVNRLVVRVDDRRNRGDLPQGPGGGWFNFGGINQEVYLRAVQRADIQRVQIRTLVPCAACSATIEEQATVRNVTGRPQTVVLRGTYGGARLTFGARTIAPGASWTPSATVLIPHARLWAPGSPTLYRARFILSDAKGRAIGGYTTYSGIRTISVTPDGRLELNGHLLSLRGVNLHEQSIVTGNALSPAQLGTLMAWVRELGATIIRAHYPLNPELEEMADRDGILLWSEVQVYQTGNSYLAQAGWRAKALGLLRTNILTNQNHPSILLWSIGNELPTPVPGGEAKWIRAASTLAHTLDPTRPVGMAISDWPGVACQSAYAPLDVIGVNEYFGWFDAGGGTTDDRDQLSPFLDFVRSCYPHQALMVSEFGVDGNRTGPVDARGTYAFQVDAMQYHLGVFATKPWLSGAIWFAMQDFAARPGWAGGDPLGVAPFVQKGVVDLYGNDKPSFATMQSIYRSTVQIAPARRR
jgi:beta-glucuronidase